MISRLEEAKHTSMSRLKKRSRTNTKVAWEDAQRDKEWVVKAKEQIFKEASEKLARGNGLILQEGASY
jgi:hypothetical protein